MKVTVLATCHVTENPASPPSARGYVVVCATFYEQ
jgi:hypothetical protein